MGFVVDWLNDSYQLEVLKGAAVEARSQGAELVILPGGVLGAAHDHGGRRNDLYRLVSPERLAGLVVMTGTLGNAGGSDVMERVAPGFPKERVCHIAVSVEGSPSVLIDNRSGMRRIVEHLVVVHRRNKIAFICGPESNPEATARLAAYRDVLEAFGVELDERLVVPGDFRFQAGIDAVRTLFDVRGLTTDDVDAIVAADDLMALAAMEELRARGIRVPVEVAVVGFDDVEEARFASPPLSTVRQPLAEQGRMAVRTVIEAIRAGTAQKPPVLETLSRFRRSCGCTAEDPGALTARPKSDTRLSLKDSVVRRRRQIGDELRSEVGSLLLGIPNGWEGELVDAVLATLEGRDEAFREAFDHLVERLVAGGIHASVGHALVSALRRQLSVCAGDDPEQIRRVEGLLHDARILTSNAVGRFEAQQRLLLEREVAGLSRASAMIASIRGEGAKQQLEQALGLMGVSQLVLFRVESDLRMTQLLSFGNFCFATEGGQLSELIPVDASCTEDGTAVLIEPLDDGQNLIGLSVLRWEEVRPHLVEVLRDLLGRAVLNIGAGQK